MLFCCNPNTLSLRLKGEDELIALRDADDARDHRLETADDAVVATREFNTFWQSSRLPSTWAI